MKMKSTLLGLTVAVMSGVTSASISHVSRYETVDNKPTLSQLNPLLAVQTMKFPLTVTTIGEAVEYWIRHTGYKLIEDKNKKLETKEILAQSLPQVDRTLGPVSVKDGLEVLLGKGVFNVVQDPLHRRLNFELTSRYKKIYSAKARG